MQGQIRDLKDSFKKCDNENRKRGNKRSSCPYFDDFDQVLSSRNAVKLPEFCEVGVADEEILQESPPHKETSVAKNHEEYNSPANKRKFSDFAEDDIYLTELTEESKQNNHEKVKQASRKAKSFHEELLNLQWEQMKMFKMSKKGRLIFNREKKQLEVDTKEKEKDWGFFLEFGKMLKNEKWNINN